MNKKGFLQLIVSTGLIFLFLVGCSVPATVTTSPIPQPAATTVSPSPIPQPSATSDYVLVPIDCIVTHSGWEGIVVASGVTKPTTGIIVAFQCNGKDVGLANTSIADGYIETKDFGKIGIRFASQIQTIGAGEFMKVAEGFSLPERASEVYVQNSMQKNFTNQYPK
jgi:hypothetical protein